MLPKINPAPTPLEHGPLVGQNFQMTFVEAEKQTGRREAGLPVELIRPRWTRPGALRSRYS
jgi:hypothetical protein